MTNNQENLAKVKIAISALRLIMPGCLDNDEKDISNALGILEDLRDDYAGAIMTARGVGIGEESADVSEDQKFEMFVNLIS